jgi:hypothetical protein
VTGSIDEPVAESALSVHAGCVAGPEDIGAGCVDATGEESQAEAPPPAAGDVARCAAPVPMDASNPKATPPQSLRELERALRGLGYTRQQAEHIAAKGFAGVTAAAAPEPEPDPDMQALAAALQRRGRAFER